MAIVVLPRIEQENPFGELAQVIGEQALPYLIKLYANKDKIAKLSDTELTDFVEVLRRYAPELVVDGKINWDKVNEWAQSDDQTKLNVATFLFGAKRMREDFANAPLIAKLQAMNLASPANPDELNKIFVVGKMQQKLAELIGNPNIPDNVREFILNNIEKFADRPDLIPFLGKILSGIMQAGNTVKAQDSGGGTGSWQFSLDGSKPFGIQLEEPILTPPQVSPPQMPVVKQQPVVRQGGGGTGQRPAGGTKEAKQNQQPNNQPFDPNYTPKTVGLISAPDLVDLLTFGAGAGATWLASRLGLGKAVGKVAGKVGSVFKKTPKSATQKEAQQVAENVAKKETQNVASNQAQNVVRQTEKSKYDIRREEVAKRIEQQMKEAVKTQEPKKLDELEKVLKQNEDKLKQVLEEEKRRLKEIEKQIDKTRTGLNPSQANYIKRVEKDADEMLKLIAKYEEKYGKKQSKVSEETKKSLFDLKAMIEKVKTKINIKKAEKELVENLTKETKTLDDFLKLQTKPRVRTTGEIKEAEKRAKEEVMSATIKKAQNQAKKSYQISQPKYFGKPEEMKIVKPAEQTTQKTKKTKKQNTSKKKRKTDK